MTDTTRAGGVPPTPLRMLILEDSPRDAKLTASILEEGGYKVQFEVTDSPEVFLERLEKTKFDLILADFNLRNWTAFDALEILKQSGKDIPIIVVTGSLGDEAAAECIKQGAADFVLKDRPARLPAAVQRALQERRLRDESHWAQVALRESEERFRSLVENATVGIYRTTGDGRVLMANPALVRMLGFERVEELAARNLETDGFEPGYPRSTFRERLGREGVITGLEAAWTRRDGSKIFVRESAKAIKDDDGQLKYYDGIVEDITERKKVEEALRASEAGFRLLFISNPLPMWVYDIQTFRFMEVNDAAVAHYGYSRGEFLRMRLTDIRPAEDVPALLEDLAQGRPAFEESGPWRHQLKDGRIIRVHITSHTMEWNGREAALVVAQDITERLRAEEALQRSEAYLAAGERLSHNGSWALNLSSREIYWSEETYRIFGFDPTKTNASVQETFLPRIHPEDLPSVKAGLDAASSMRNTHEDDYRIVLPDGSIRHVHDIVYPVVDDTGKVVERFGVVIDVTERKKAEGESSRLAAIVNSSGDAIFSTSREGNIITWNAGAERMYGYTAEEIKGKPFTLLIPKDRHSDIAPTDERLYGGEPLILYEFEHLRKDGSRFPVSLTLSPIKDAAGVITGVSVISRDVTASKQAEEALRQNEKKYRRLYESMRDGFVRVDMDGRIRETNDVFCKILGYTREELINLPYNDLVPERWHIVERSVIEEEVLTRGYSEIYFEEFRRKDGAIIPVEVRKYLRLDDSENPSGMWGIVRDITERKWSEEKLREYEKAVEGAQDMITVIDKEYSYLLANRAYLDRHGLERTEVVGSLVSQVLGEEFFAGVVKQKLDECFQGNVVRYEMKYRYPKLGERDLLASYFPIEGYSGVDRVACVLQDITDRKRAEAENTRLVTAIEHSAEAVVITNTNGDIEYVNPAFTGITGYGREEVLGRNPRILKSGKHDPAMYEQLWKTILNGQIWQGELTNRRKDGTLYTEQMNIAPVRGARGEVTHFIATKLDVTARKQLELQLIQAQKMEAVGRLAGGVAHDFNNLLTIINGYAELLSEQISPEDPRRGHLAEILMAGERAASLTRQLLAFSRRQVMEPRVLDLNRVISDIEKMLRRLISEDVELVTMLKPDIGSVKVDAGQIEQVVMNLAVNARDAMPGGGKLFIETSNVEVDEEFAGSHPSMAPGKYVMLAVTDTGLGMDIETQAHIFEPFFTTKEKGQGTGLGLATVYGIVKQSGGSIWVYSEPGRGSTFKVYFPRVEDSVPTLEPAKAPGEMANGSETVLVVEDEKGVRSLACQTLTLHGYKVLEAEGAAQALKIAEQHREPIHLLLTDVVMPQTSGKELAMRLSTLHPETIVLYMSGYTDDSIVRHGILEVGTSFLQKPFAPIALVRKVREVIDMKSGTQQ